MKIRFLITAIIIGVIASGGFVYIYAQMYDCLHPPTWMKPPRSYSATDCLNKFVNGNLPHYANQQKFLDAKIGSELDLPIAKITEIKNNNKIIISGSVGNPIDDVYITIFIKNQNNELLQVAQVTPDDDGQFSYSIDANGPIWKKTTNYFVEINYNDLKSVIGSDWSKRK